MKYKIVLLFILAFHFHALAQFGEPMRTSVVVLKNGEILQGIGKTKKKGFKFKSNDASDAYTIDFSEIDYIQQEFSKAEKKIFRFFETDSDASIIKVEELINGEKVQLYAQIYTVNTGGVGEMSMTQTVVKYYIKRKSDTRLTMLGRYIPLANNLKEKVKMYFSDCAELLKKIEEKEFRMRSGLEQIVNFYNENCETN
ncbi:hypothetical protein GOQ30_09550 [Flavobacterium sp. TP390]|uniref:DUF4468 domain-containing protein n=1 Tax=Flavobacterium profundi TaxID=1774945 RepID=A0A6I4ILR8_9FLAO|nr:hypothetical protein [Flavobacterium profundi]MVO09402.1 hypothetical protein [Flavobacterium profundi]